MEVSQTLGGFSNIFSSRLIVAIRIAEESFMSAIMARAKSIRLQTKDRSQITDSALVFLINICL